MSKAPRPATWRKRSPGAPGDGGRGGRGRAQPPRGAGARRPPGRRAGAGVGAADVGVALLLVPQLRAALGAVGGHDELVLVAGAGGHGGPADLAGGVAGPAD